MWQTCHHLQGSMEPRCRRLPMTWPCTVHIRQLLLLAIQFPLALKDTSQCPRAPRSLDQCFQNGAMVIAPHSRACQGLPTGVRLLLQNEEVKLVSQTRLLGIIIDDSLSWSPHVDSICKKVGRKIGALRRTYRQLTPTARRQFFVSVIQPDLEYAASATIPFMPDWSTRSTSGAVEKGRSMSGRCSSSR